MRRMLLVLCTLALASTVVALPERMAHACSCMEMGGDLPPYQVVAGAASAVVGKVSGMGPVRGGIAVARVSVEAAIHEPAGRTVDLPLDVASSCAVHVSEGDRIGVLLPEEPDEWGVGMCSLVDADLLLAGAELPQASAPGPPAYAATGPLGHAATVYLAADGAVVGYGDWDEPVDRPVRSDRGMLDSRVVDVCPGGATVEYVGDIAWAGQRPSPRIVVRESSTGAVSWTVTVAALLDESATSGPNVFQSAHCVDDDGQEVIAVLGYYDPPDVGRRRVVRLTPEGFTTIAEGPFHEVLPLGDRAVVRLGDGTVMGWLDLDSGDVTEVLALPAATRTMQLSATADSVWVTTGPHHLEEEPTDPISMARIDLASEAVSAEVAIPQTEGFRWVGLVPLADGGVLVSAGTAGGPWPVGTGGSPRYLRYDAGLAITGEWTGPDLHGLTERDGTIAGIGAEHAVWVARAGESRFFQLADDLDLPLRGLHALPDGLPAGPKGDAAPSAAVFRPGSPAVLDDATPAGDAAGGEAAAEERSMPWPWALALLLLVIAGAGVAQARASRREGGGRA